MLSSSKKNSYQSWEIILKLTRKKNSEMFQIMATRAREKETEQLGGLPFIPGAGRQMLLTFLSLRWNF